MRTIDELLHDVPVFEGMAPEHLELIAGCARNCRFAPGEYLEREGDAADTFYVIRQGTVALETFVPSRGPLVIETLHEQELVGWSWLFAPYRTSFDVRSVGATRGIAFDAACLRSKLDDDRVLGYELMKRFTDVILRRLQATRLRLMDVYGNVPAG
jgi:CRP/FNR family transcriptional regulator, cyclic AMP receptor protein